MLSSPGRDSQEAYSKLVLIVGVPPHQADGGRRSCPRPKEHHRLDSRPLPHRVVCEGEVAATTTATAAATTAAPPPHHNVGGRDLVKVIDPNEAPGISRRQQNALPVEFHRLYPQAHPEVEANRVGLAPHPGRVTAASQQARWTPPPPAASHPAAGTGRNGRPAKQLGKEVPPGARCGGSPVGVGGTAGVLFPEGGASAVAAGLPRGSAGPRGTQAEMQAGSSPNRRKAAVGAGEDPFPSPSSPSSMSSSTPAPVGSAAEAPPPSAPSPA